MEPRIARAVCLVLLFAGVVAAPPASAGHEYHQRVIRYWEDMDVDVLVTGIDDDSIGGAIIESIEAWRVGIDQLAPAWFRDNFTMRVHFPARDPVPPAGFEPDDLEVLFVPYGNTAYVGSSLTCVATAPNWQWGESTYYRVAAHEFGHCLGLSHVYNHGIEYSPGFDVMGSGAGHPCPSNLNMVVLEHAFGYVRGLPGERNVVMPSSQYHQSLC